MNTKSVYIPDYGTTIETVDELYKFFDKKLKEIHYVVEKRCTCMLYPFEIHCFITKNLAQQFFINHFISDNYYTLQFNKINVDDVYKVSIHTFYGKYASDIGWTDEFV